MSAIDDTTTNPFDPPLPTGPDEINSEIVTALQALIPQLRLLPGELLTHLVASLAQVSAEGREAFVALMVERLTELLGTLHQIPQLPGTPATSSITVTAIDTVGHSISDGARLYVGGVPCETVGTLTIPAGLDLGTVPIQTVDPGTALNGAVGEVQLDETEAWIAEDGVALDGAFSDGTDPETQVAYGIRLRDELQILSGKPILPVDFAVLARRHLAVEYAWAIDCYDVETDTHDLPLTETVVIAGPDAAAPNPQTIAEVRADLEGRLVANWVVRVVAPTYVPVDVTATVVPQTGWDPDVVAAIVTDRLAAYLAPQRRISSPQDGDPNYVPAAALHKNDLIDAGYGEGVRHIPDLQIGDGTSDSIEMPSLIALTTPGTITVTATA